MRTGGWYTINGANTTVCRDCGAGGLAWVTSKRTGNKYLCGTRQVGDGVGDLRWVMPNAPHTRELCEGNQRQHAEAMQTAQDNEGRADWNTKVEAILERVLLHFNDMTQDERDRVINVEYPTLIAEGHAKGWRYEPTPANTFTTMRAGR